MPITTEDRRRRQKIYRLDVARGRSHSLVDAGPARERITALMAAGYTASSIGRAAGVPHDTITGIAYGRRTRITRRTARRLRDLSVARVIAATPATALVPKVGATRRIRALQRAGYSMREIAEAAGISYGTVRAAAYVHPDTRGPRIHVRREAHDAIDYAYRTLGMTPGTNRHSRTIAVRNGWPPPLAWDDGVIDEPDGCPDMAAVDNGAGHAGMLPEDVAWIVEECGPWTWPALLDRLGVTTPDAVRAALKRAGRPELLARVRLVDEAVPGELREPTPKPRWIAERERRRKHRRAS